MSGIESDLPRVSIMIPTYNQAGLVGKAIESALSQDYPNLEVVVSDDNSPDDTEGTVRSYLGDRRVRYFRNSNNLGPTGNYHSCLYEHCTGIWALNLDGDDYLYDPTYVSSAMELARKRPEVVLVIGDRLEYSQTRNRFALVPAGKNLPEVMDGTELFLDYWRGQVKIHHLSAIFRREEAMKIDFYRTEIVSSDWESFLRLIVGRCVGYVSKVAGVWRVHGMNDSRTADVARRMSNFQLVELPYEYFRARKLLAPGELDCWRRHMLESVIRDTVCGYLNHLEYRKAIAFAKACSNAYPHETRRAVSRVPVVLRALMPGFEYLRRRIEHVFEPRVFEGSPT